MRLFYDFHIHSCLSPCGDNDMTPNNIVNMTKLMGLDVIALTDHNTSGNCRACMEAGEEIGITVIPGMELCTAEEVHIVCLFPEIDMAESFSHYVLTTVPPIKNKPSVFGEQLFMDKLDNITGSFDTLLITASSISASKVSAVVKEFGGVSFPAHIDRTSYSIISNLGTVDESFGFTHAEIFDMSLESELKAKYPYLNELTILSDSDAHYLENMRAAKRTIEATENTAQAVIEALR